MSEVVLLGEIVHRFGGYLGAVRLSLREIRRRFPESIEDNKELHRIFENLEKGSVELTEFLQTLRQTIIFQDQIRPLDPWVLIETALRRIDFPKNIQVVKQKGDSTLLIGATPTLVEVIHNLIFNAIDAMPKGGELALTLEHKREQKLVVLKVQDNGIGISRDNMGKIFREFFSTKETGQGIGLYWSKLYLEQLDATINLESQIDKGTIVQVTFPEI